jgi:hypothetical protein
LVVVVVELERQRKRAAAAVGGQHGVAAHAGMVIVQLGYSGYHVLTQFVLNEGVNQVIICIYHDLLAVAVLAPVAFLHERYRRRTAPIHSSSRILCCVQNFSNTFLLYIVVGPPVRRLLCSSWLHWVLVHSSFPSLASFLCGAKLLILSPAPNFCRLYANALLFVVGLG